MLMLELMSTVGAVSATLCILWEPANDTVNVIKLSCYSTVMQWSKTIDLYVLV